MTTLGLMAIASASHAKDNCNTHLQRPSAPATHFWDSRRGPYYCKSVQHSFNHVCYKLVELDDRIVLVGDDHSPPLIWDRCHDEISAGPGKSDRQPLYEFNTLGHFFADAEAGEMVVDH
jgi:hypothetical protein